MQHIIGISRQQLRFSSLEDTISPDNQVCFIDTFVEYIELSKIGFAHLGTARTFAQQTIVLSTFFLNTSSSWGVKKQMTLPHQEFIRRFALHILPKRFVKIRHYGFLSSIP